MEPRPAALLTLLTSTPLGPAHGLAKVLCDLASDYGTAIPCEDLIDLAKQLTANLPPPYGSASRPPST